MLIKRFIKRRFSILALVSVIAVSFCLIPCGNAGVLNAEAASHADVHGMSAHEYEKPEKHGCHSGEKSHLQVENAQQDNCLHCDTLASAVLNKSDVQISKLTIDQTINHSLVTSSYVSKSLFTVKVRPPGSKRPIHVINSTYLI